MQRSLSKPSNSKPGAKRRASEQAGRRAELIAEWLLRLQFYAIVARRYKTPVGEIDLVAQRFGTTVFVEVKARASGTSYGEALEAVNERRISSAACFYLAKNPRLAHSDLRFDVIFLAPLAWPRHVRAAFDAS